MKKDKASFFVVILLLMSCFSAASQPALQNNYSFSMEVPSVIAMESSEAHLYVLSQTEGMAVFRTRTDSLQWLYTSGGMQQRGDAIEADIRFAYLFGNSRRLTVLEPTSVLGAYSSTNLPSQPLDAERLDENLYIVLGSGELGMLNLSSPEALDSPVEKVTGGQLNNKTIIEIEASSNRLFVLSNDSTLIIFSKNEGGISVSQTISLNEDINRLFYLNDGLMGSNNEGDIFEVTSAENLNQLGSIGEAVIEIKSWNNWLIIKGSSNRLWTSYRLREPTLWKENRDAGNHFAVSKGQLWISEYNRISRINEVDRQASTQSAVKTGNPASAFKIQPISDQVIPYPHALLIPLRIKGDFPAAQVQFSLQTNVENAIIRGQSLYWQPQSRNAGEHRFKLNAATGNGQSSSTSFTVEVRSFNAPPRFTPLRTISIPVGRPFNLPIKAIDPDGTNKNLIRYLGVNLPNGASIDEQTGEFNWTPTERQAGENTFRVIATDQYGAASSQNVTIRVIETGSRGN
jgi:hypothetical protein